MKLFGLEVSRMKSQVLSAVHSAGGWFGILRESFGGAWQRLIEVDAPREILAFSAVFSCVTLISSDIAKLGVKMMVEDAASGLHTRLKGTSPYLSIMSRPNHYQTWYKFIEQWIVQKLLYGNTYIFKHRKDARGLVTALYILDSQRVTPLVAEDGSVYYQLSKDNLSEIGEGTVVPDTEIIHDTMVSLWHPLVGISPIYACGISATMGNRIQANSTRFFANASRPSGQLTAPGKITDETANRLKKAFEENYSGMNMGRLMVGGEGLMYQPMAIPFIESQLIEQLKWTVEDVARCFHVPMWKLGDKEPARTSVESLNQTYYSDCLQSHIEAIEELLDYGLSLPSNYHIKFDLENLMRMDTQARFIAKGQAVKDGWMKPDEARAGEDLAPVAGGDQCYLQQQNYSLAALAKRDAKQDPFETATPKVPALPAPAPAAESVPVKDPGATKLLDMLLKGLDVVEEEEDVAA